MSELPEQRLEPKVERQLEEHCRHCGQLACGELDGMVQFWCGSVSGDEPRSEECYENEIRNWKATVNRLAGEVNKWQAYALGLEEVGDGLADIAGKFGAGLFVHERKDAWSNARKAKP
jgi:hypothetical protein